MTYTYTSHGALGVFITHIFEYVFTVFYNRYDIFSNTSNNFSKLLTHQHTYNTQLKKQLI